MKYKYIHLIIDSYVRFSLKNLINNNVGHKIIIVEKNHFFDINKNRISNNSFNEYIINSEVIFAHFLNKHIAKIINDITPSKKIIWFSWGADFYNLGKFKNDLLQPKSKKIFNIISLKSIQGVKKLVWQKLGIITDYLPPNNEVIKAIKQTSVIVPVVPSDFDIINSKYSISSKKYDLNYLNGIFINPPKFDSNIFKNNVLIGNSSSFTNNHIEIIDMISKKPNFDGDIIFPLVYGNKRYRDFIIKYAKKKLGHNLLFIEDRLSIEDYMKLYTSCHSVIMNHKRQQAMGNLYFAFWFKTNVYLNLKANHAKDLIQRGFKILDVSEYINSKTLSEEDKKKNQELLIKWYGKEYLQKKFNDFLLYIESNITNQVKNG